MRGKFFDILGKQMLEVISNIFRSHEFFDSLLLMNGGLEAMWSGNKLQFERRVIASLNKSSF